MPDFPERLREHCRTKLGMTTYDQNDFRILRGSLDTFAVFHQEEPPPVALLRVHDRDRRALAKEFSGIRKSEKMHWKTKGWVWTDVPIDGSVPEEVLVRLVDRSYQLAIDHQEDYARPITQMRLDLMARKLSPRALLTELIDRYAFGHKREQIEAFAEPALLLRTRKTDEADLPAGRSKIGGRPDLPAEVAWPRHSSGKPLAFLAQINLAEAAEAANLSVLPQVGVMSVFSVYGWQVKDDYYP